MSVSSRDTSRLVFSSSRSVSPIIFSISPALHFLAKRCFSALRMAPFNRPSSALRAAFGSQSDWRCAIFLALSRPLFSAFELESDALHSIPQSVASVPTVALVVRDADPNRR